MHLAQQNFGSTNEGNDMTTKKTTLDKNANPITAEQAKADKKRAKTVSHAKRPSPTPPQVISEIHLIPLERIEVRAQVRTEFDDATIKELAQDIEQHGLLSPVLVSPIGDEKYRLVSGERRLRAIQVLGHQGIPALITKMDEKAIPITQLAENIQREEMSMKDTANAIRKMFDTFESLEVVANLVNKSKPWVSKRLSVTHPDFGFRSRRLLEDCVCEDIELLSTFSQIENLHNYEAIHQAETLIRTGNMTRQQARDFLKATKEKMKKRSEAEEEKRQKKAAEREPKRNSRPSSTRFMKCATAFTKWSVIQKW
jgi:ParB/RepB/Spo0J family partition protein